MSVRRRVGVIANKGGTADKAFYSSLTDQQSVKGVFILPGRLAYKEVNMAVRAKRWRGLAYHRTHHK